MKTASETIQTNRNLAFLVNGWTDSLNLAAELIERWIAADKAFEFHKTLALAAAIHGAVEDLSDEIRATHPVVADFFGLQCHGD